MKVIQQHHIVIMPLGRIVIIGLGLVAETLRGDSSLSVAARNYVSDSSLHAENILFLRLTHIFSTCRFNIFLVGWICVAPLHRYACYPRCLKQWKLGICSRLQHKTSSTMKALLSKWFEITASAKIFQAIMPKRSLPQTWDTGMLRTLFSRGRKRKRIKRRKRRPRRLRSSQL